MKKRFFLSFFAFLFCFSGELYSCQTTIIDMVNRGWENLQRETNGKYEFELGGIGWVKRQGDVLRISYSLVWSKDLSHEEAASTAQDLAAILFKTVAAEKDRERIFNTNDITACFSLSVHFPSSHHFGEKLDKSKMDLSKADHVGVWDGEICVSVKNPETRYSEFVLCEPLKVGQEETPDEE